MTRSPRHPLLAALIAWAVGACVLLFVGCSTTREDCGLSGPLTIPDQYAVAEQLRQACAEVEAETGIRPNCNALMARMIEWRPCQFRVPHPCCGFPANGCYAGVTRFPDGITVSTAEPGRTLGLVKWEAKNFYFIAVGRRDRASIALREPK